VECANKNLNIKKLLYLEYVRCELKNQNPEISVDDSEVTRQ